MHEIQFNVSHAGRHLFRTDWYPEGDATANIELALGSRFPSEQGYRVTASRRMVHCTIYDVEN